MSHSLQFEFSLFAIATVGLISLTIWRRKDVHSSWPTWLFIPLAILVALPLGAYSKPPDPLHPFCAVILTLVLIRWFIAIIRRERNFGWILYLFVLVVVPFVLFPAMEGLKVIF